MRKLLFDGDAEMVVRKYLHHEAQEKGRMEIFSDYHLRVGQVTKDTKIPVGYELHEQRLDETEIGEATTVVFIDGQRPSEWVKNAKPQDVAEWLGLDPKAIGLVEWDVFEAVLKPGDVILLMSWRTHLRAEAFEQTLSLPEGARLRRVRVVRDYGMYDRREAPQYYPDVKGETAE